MTQFEALWVDEEQVAANVSLAEAIDIVERGLVTEARGEAVAMEKTHASWPEGTLHALGAVSIVAGFAATKTWAHTGQGSTPLLILFDRESGALRAVIEAFALGQLRTAAVSAVATRWLAPKDATEVAIIGTGKQALAQVAAIAHVRRVRRVRVFSPNPAHRKAFAESLRAEMSREVVEASSVAAAVEGASIVTLATRANQPFLSVDLLAPGAHVNAIGAITPERAELGQDVLARARRVVVDSLPAARRFSREMIDFYGTADEAWKDIETLTSLVGAKRGREAETDLTLFKAMGTGMADLALAIEVYYRVRRAGGGRELPQPERVRPRLLPGGRD